MTWSYHVLLNLPVAVNWLLAVIELCGREPFDVVGWAALSMACLVLAAAPLLCLTKRKREPADVLHLLLVFFHFASQTAVTSAFWAEHGTRQSSDPARWQARLAFFGATSTWVLFESFSRVVTLEKR